MTLNWNSIRSLSLSTIVVRFGLVGAVSGFVAWVVVLGLHVLFDVSRPSVMALILAIPRGAVYGMILALILHAYWKRHSRKG